MLGLLFNDNSGHVLTLESVVGEMTNFINTDRKRSYKIIVGTDSLLLNNKKADFVTALVIHRVGNGGRYFWRRVNLGSFHTLRDRILREVLISLEVAKQLLLSLQPILVKNEINFNTAESGGVEDLKSRVFGWISSGVDFEIHIDIGENGETRAMISEIVGMVRAHNFEPKTKPMSFGATKVADRHC